MGIEDAGVLAELLAVQSTKERLPDLAKLYYQLRQPRVERCRAFTHHHRPVMAFPDGPEQVSRDEYLQTPPPQRKPDHELAKSLGDLQFHAWINGFDFIKEVSPYQIF